MRCFALRCGFLLALVFRRLRTAGRFFPSGGRWRHLRLVSTVRLALKGRLDLGVGGREWGVGVELEVGLELTLQDWRRVVFL